MQKRIAHPDRVFTIASIVFLCLAWLLCAFGHLIWLKGCGYPPVGQGISFILSGMHYAKLLLSKGFLRVVNEMYRDPATPLFSFLDLIFTAYYWLFGVTSRMELVVPLFFLGVGMAGVYAVAARFFSKSAGIVAAITFGSVIDVIVHARCGGYREYYIMCIVPLTLFFILSSDRFNNNKYSALSGLFIGLSMSIRFDAIIWLLTPLLFNFIALIKGAGVKLETVKTQSKNILSCFGVLLGMIIIWYLPRPQRLFPGADPFFYLMSIKSKAVSSGLMAYIVLSGLYVIIFSLMARRKSPQGACLKQMLVYAIVPILFIFMMKCQYRELILPFLAFLSIIVGGLYDLIRPKLVQLVFLTFLCVHLLVVQYEAATYIYPAFAGTNVLLKLSVLDRIGEIFGRKPSGRLLGALKENEAGKRWDECLEESLSIIRGDSALTKVKPRNADTINILFIANAVPMRMFQMEYYAAKLSLRFSFIPVIYYETEWDESLGADLLYNQNADYIISEDFGAEEVIREGENYGVAALHDYMLTHKDKFGKNYRLIKDMVSPRASNIRIYRAQKDSNGA